MAAILRGPSQMPVLPSRRAAARPKVPAVLIRTLLEQAQVGVQVLAGGEIDDRVTDDLPGAVVGDVAAAVGLEDRDAAFRQLGLVPDHVLLGTLAHAEGVNRIVFREDQRVADPAGVAAGDEFLLSLPGVRITGPAPVEGREGLGGGDGHADSVARVARGASAANFQPVSFCARPLCAPDSRHARPAAPR
jgi:hypothetical protein